MKKKPSTSFAQENIKEELSEESLGQVAGGTLADIVVNRDIGGRDIDLPREKRLLMESLVNNDSANNQSINGL